MAAKPPKGVEKVKYEDFDQNNEIVVSLADGWTLRSGLSPAGKGEFTTGEYVRICKPDGTEFAYWDNAEWEEDPVNVMGAIVNVMAGYRPKRLEDR